MLGAAGIATLLKRGTEIELVGTVENKVCIIVDDMIDTGSRATDGARILHRSGAALIYGAMRIVVFFFFFCSSL
jgi:ribose-phosphate pyrophosphokinase